MWLDAVNKATYIMLEEASIQLARQCRALYQAGRKREAYALFLTDPLGNGLSFEEWDAAMERARAREDRIR